MLSIRIICTIWFILIPAFESSRIPIQKFLSNKRIEHSFKNDSKIKRTIVKKIPSIPKAPTSFFPAQIDLSFSVPSMLTGILLSGVAYYYLENQDLKTKNLRNRLLLGEDEVLSEMKRGTFAVPTDLIKDPYFFKEALNRGNQELCIHLLQSGQTIKILNEISSENLLVKIIEKRMDRVMEHLLKNRVDQISSALDVMDDVSGKTPLLAAIQAKDFKSARTLLHLGAKPLIPTTSRFQARDIKSFMPKIEDSESEEFVRELRSKYSTDVV